MCPKMCRTKAILLVLNHRYFHNISYRTKIFWLFSFDSLVFPFFFLQVFTTLQTVAIVHCLRKCGTFETIQVNQNSTPTRLDSTRYNAHLSLPLFFHFCFFGRLWSSFIWEQQNAMIKKHRRKNPFKMKRLNEIGRMEGER